MIRQAGAVILALGFGVFFTAGRALSAENSELQFSSLSPQYTSTLPAGSLLEPSEKKLDFSWRLHMTGMDYSQGSDAAQMVQTRATGKFIYHITPEFWTRMIINAAFDAGHTQTLSGDLQPKNVLYPTELSANWKPWDFMLLKGGVLSQSAVAGEEIDVNLYYDSFLLFDHQAFPGTQETFLLEQKNLKASLTFEQAVPTSTTLSTQAMSQEPLPRFASETVRGEWGPVESFSLAGWITHFSFFDLPSSVAEQSRWGGNTIYGDQNAYFAYPFQGALVGLSATVKPNSRVSTSFGAHYLQNFLAPDHANRGQLGYLAANYHLNSKMDLLPLVDVFRLESDASPAFYNSFQDGHNNRVGQGAQVELRFKQWGFKIGFRYEQTTPIDYNPLQQPAQLYLFELETDYASI